MLEILKKQIEGQHNSMMLLKQSIDEEASSESEQSEHDSDDLYKYFGHDKEYTSPDLGEP